jgi:rhodanese-related sulfurtransferase
MNAYPDKTASLNLSLSRCTPADPPRTENGNAMSSHPRTPAVAVAELPAGAYLIDVREADEWSCGHAPEAVHLPLSELMARIAEVPEDQSVYVICKVGGRSEQAVNYLNQLGRSTVNVSGGMLAWQAAGKTMITESGREPFVA